MKQLEIRVEELEVRKKEEARLAEIKRKQDEERLAFEARQQAQFAEQDQAGEGVCWFGLPPS